MFGTLPDCLSDLNFLTKIRITDMGLVGTLPEGLCEKPEMNGLSPNTFGCDAIACGAGYYQPAGGRQSNRYTECIECNVPSNVIGSTQCQWYHGDEDVGAILTPYPTIQPTELPSSPPTNMPTRSPTITPSTSPVESRIPSKVQSVAPSVLIFTNEPTGMAEIHPTPSDTPSPWPTSSSPSQLSVGTLTPTVYLSAVSFRPSPSTKGSIDGIVDGNYPVNADESGKAIITGSVIAVLFVLLSAVLFTIARRKSHRQEEGRTTAVVEKGGLDRCEESDLARDCRITVEETGTNENQVNRQQSILRYPSLLDRDEPLARPTSTRRVHFAIPDALSLSMSMTSLDMQHSDRAKKGDVSNEQDVEEGHAPGRDADAWATWIMNPPCGPLCSAAVDEDEEESSIASPVSPSNSTTPLLDREKPSNLSYFCLETASRQQDVQELGESVLGIQSRDVMEDDTTIEDLEAELRGHLQAIGEPPDDTLLAAKDADKVLDYVEDGQAEI